MDFLLAIFYIFAFSLVLWFYKPLKFNSLPNWIPIIGFIFKIFIGFIFLQVYVYHYPKNIIPSDSIRFFHDAKVLNGVFFTSEKEYFKLLLSIGNEKEQIRQYLSETHLWDSGRLSILNDFRNVIRLNSLIYFISNGSAFTHIIFMSFLSFIGIHQIFKAISPISKLKPTFIFFLLLFIPSMLFWTSGILKEPIVLLGIGLLIRVIFYKEPYKNKILPFILSFIILIGFKPYLLFCLIPALLFSILNKYLFNYQYYKSIITIVLTTLIIILFIPKTVNQIVHYAYKRQTNFALSGKGGLIIEGNSCFYQIEKKSEKNISIDKLNYTAKILKSTQAICYSNDYHKLPFNVTLQPNLHNYKIKSNEPPANSYFEHSSINNSTTQLMKNVPEAFINALFRPFITDSNSKLKYPAIIEILSVFSFIFIAFYYRRSLSKEMINTILSIILFATILLLLIGWITPISGAIFRYRFPVQLALVIIGILLIDPAKIKQFSFNKKTKNV
ncbi:MAG: hypothetical protein LW701_05745 [Fluviicola sp.]|jgi:hypothetical protein|nr:hypothetical protein [Fluviicola sp.]